ncbi:hypothetical protein [Roseibium album]|uniref:hypothetical protein n=1 Tax=Roseibium album TaxID=311410 RepID=UPI003297BD92
MTKKTNRKIILSTSILLVISGLFMYLSVNINSKIIFDVFTILGFVTFFVFLLFGVLPAGVNLLRWLHPDGPFGPAAEGNVISHLIFDEEK